MMEKKSKIAIFTVYSFPNGLAATNRILAYSKGLSSNKAEVNIYIPFPTDRPDLTNYKDKDNYQGVNYNYPIGKYSHKLKIIRAFSMLTGFRFIFGLIKTIKIIKSEHKKDKFNVIIISTDSLPYLYVFSLLAKNLKISSIFIFDEFPTPIRHKLKEKISRIKRLLLKKILNQITAYISISKELEKFYKDIVDKETFILPVIIDTSRFDQVKMKNSNKTDQTKYLCYMGNMELSKDNVDLIIKAFSLISEKYCDIFLYLYGLPSVKNLSIINNLISSLQLNDKVFLKGKVNSEEVPQILSNAYILVSSQPDTKRASGGFPTKLGEYVISATPSLLTDVGENSKYLKENEHVFFCKPDDHYEYAKKLEYIIENYELALSIGQKGKQFMIENFSNDVIGRDMLKFINSI